MLGGSLGTYLSMCVRVYATHIRCVARSIRCLICFLLSDFTEFYAYSFGAGLCASRYKNVNLNFVHAHSGAVSRSRLLCVR